MKLKNTILLTFVLLLMMLSAGTLSALWAFTLGTDALKGVTQPDVNPTKKLTGDNTPSQGKGLTIVDEKTILVKVYDYIHHKKEKGEATVETSSNDVSSEEKDKNSFIKVNSEEKEQEQPKITPNLPIKTQSQGVSLQVMDISQRSGSLLLNVSLKNSSSEDIRFLYSFLDIRDEDNRALSAITDGLPGEIPANGTEFTGTVRIPMALLDDTQKISLSLTDYPDQTLQLKLDDIPVLR